MLKVMIKNLRNLSIGKAQYPLIFNYRGFGEEVQGESGERSLSKWNQGKVIEIS